MAEQSIDIKAFVDYQWKELDEKSLAHAFRRRDLKLADEPTLIIGIGGTGVEAARCVKRKVEEHYHPDAAQKLEYLFIDTDSNSVAGLDDSDTLIIQSADTAILLREYKEKGPSSSITLPPEICQWLDPDLSPFRVMNGAAGIRQGGRLILFLNINRVYHKLKQKLDKVSVKYDLQQTTIKVHIFLGIGGGTGSGMFMDISYLLRSIRRNCVIQGFVFMPDVSCMKPGLYDIHQRNIRRNAYAALKEIEQLMTMDLYKDDFQQSYPNKQANILTRYPVFDFCVLVGSMQDGRQALGSEQEVFEHVAEYLLLELHQKEEGVFDFRSFKSNLCVDASKEYFFTKYVAVDVDAKYLPVDHFYSWWLSDVLELICNGLEQALSKSSGFIAEMLEDENEFWEDKMSGVHWYSGKKKYNSLQSTISILLTGKLEGKMAPPRSLQAKLDLLGSQAKIAQKKSLAEMKKKPGKIKYPLNRIRWWRFANRCIEAYKATECYTEAIISITQHSEQFSQLMREIDRRCREYRRIRPDSSSFAFAEKAFEQMRNGNQYKMSVRDAANKIVDDFLQNPKLWLGHELTARGRYLPDYLAATIGREFVDSGCTSIYKLIETATQAGVPAAQEQFVQQVLEELHAAPLWPIKEGITANTIQGYSAMNILACSNDETIQNWVESWRVLKREQLSSLPNKMHDRVARGVYASGYALKYFEGIYDLEREFEEAPGVWMYAGERAGWNRPFSAWFSYDWTGSATSSDQKEAHRYRTVFDKALEAKRKDGLGTLIYYDETQKRYFYQSNKDVKPRPIGPAGGTGPMDQDKDYYRSTVEFFIRMRSLREEVEQALNSSNRAQE